MTSTSSNTETFETADIPSFPFQPSAWTHDDPDHPGFLVHGLDDTPGNKAYLIHLEAKPGKEDALMQFLHDINNGVNKEPGTGPWFGTRYSKSTFLIFEAFPSAQARHEHDGGPGGTNFLRSDVLKDVLAVPAQLYRLDVLHGKFGTMFGQKVQAV